MRAWTLGWGIGAVLVGCGSNVVIQGTSSSGGGGADGSVVVTAAATGGGGQAIVTIATTGGGIGGDGGSGGVVCASTSAETTVDKAPADIIFVVDNSGSMNEEIAAVESNINVNFANIVSAAQIDYQVLMVTDHGTSNYELCVSPPLSPQSDCNAPPGQSELFHHYDVNVQSHDSLCIVLDTLSGKIPDQHGQYPNGWLPLLRQEAIKFFIEISDDGTACSSSEVYLHDSVNGQFPEPGQQAATDFDTQLSLLSTQQFGDSSKRKYKFYSIIGITPNNPPTTPYNSADPVIEDECPSAIDPGQTYQWLSKGTGGYRYPVCQHADYGPIFEQIANDVLVTTAIPCMIDLPDEPMGESFDLTAVEVGFTPAAGDPAQPLTQVGHVGECSDSGLEFYVEDNRVELCPAACSLVSGTGVSDGTVSVDVRCQ